MMVRRRSVEQGSLKFGADREGETTFSLTEQGEKHALDVIGGEDIACVATGLTKLIVKHGNAFGGEVNDDIGLWLIMIQVAQLWKQYHRMDWDSFVAKIRQEVMG